MISLVTYASHEAGNFKNMINNLHGHKVTVLGMGTTWNGFMDKTLGMIQYCESIVDKNKILVFLDGFDVWINVDKLDKVEKQFLNYNCRLLFSSSGGNMNMYAQKLFLQPQDRWRNISVANMGLYMGYVGDIENLFKTIVNSNKVWNDDQVAVNALIHKMPNVRIDDDQIIFKNVPLLKNNIEKAYTAYFIQNNGRLTIERLSRVWREYHTYFVGELCVIFFILGLLCVNHKKWVIGVGATFIIFLALYNCYFESIINTPNKIL